MFSKSPSGSPNPGVSTIVNNDQVAALTPMETVTERSSARVNLPQRPSEIFPFVEEHGCTRYWGATDSTSGTWAIYGQYMGNTWAIIKS